MSAPKSAAGARANDPVGTRLMSSGRYAPNPAWAEYVRRLVDQAPPLTPAQVDRLTVLLQTAPAPRGQPPRRSRPPGSAPADFTGSEGTESREEPIFG